MFTTFRGAADTTADTIATKNMGATPPTVAATTESNIIDMATASTTASPRVGLLDKATILSSHNNHPGHDIPQCIRHRERQSAHSQRGTPIPAHRIHRGKHRHNESNRKHTDSIGNKTAPRSCPQRSEIIHHKHAPPHPGCAPGRPTSTYAKALRWGTLIIFVKSSLTQNCDMVKM